MPISVNKVPTMLLLGSGTSKSIATLIERLGCRKTLIQLQMG